MPSLYRNMVLDVYRLDADLEDTFGADHQGLPLIETICVTADRFVFGSDAHQPALCFLLELIPKNALQRFECVPTLDEGSQTSG